MTKKNKWFILVLGIIFLSLVIFIYLKNEDNAPRIEVNGVKVKVEIADTPLLQEKGLSGIESLKEDEGMLFIFENPSLQSFWMKDMRFPIDIIWFDEQMKIVWIEKNLSRSSYPSTFSPDKNSKYVLEVIAGFSTKNNLKIGDSMRFLY